MNNFKKLSLVFSMVWKVNKAYFAVLVVNPLMFSGQVMANIMLPKYLIDELMVNRDTQKIIYWVGAITLSNVAFVLIKRALRRYIEVSERKIVWGIERLFAEKIMSVEYRHLEDPAFLDLKERASFAMSNQGVTYTLVSNAITFFNELLTVAGLVAIMLTLSWVLVVSLTATIGISVLIQASFSKYQQKFYSELIPVNRKYGYYLNLTFDTQIQKETRLYEMQEMLGETVTTYNKEINRWFGKFNRRMGIAMGLFQVVVVLQTMLAYGFVGTKTLTGGIGIGDLTMYVSSAVSFSSAVLAMGMAVITVFQMLGYLTPLVQLMTTPDEVAETGNIILDKVRTIEFKNVSFSYPKTNKKVLDRVSFEIKEGEKISIVGLNGAGKSTVVKLICRLYRPDEGEILINGHNIYNYEHSSYLRQITAVFQDYRLFNFTISENITCRPADTDRDKVYELVEKVGLSEKINSLKNGIDSLFGKEYDEEGVEFSGGQSQKIAIARALYKDASLVILDEPTSALDPMAEAEIYENFNSLVGDKTALYISHRMSSSMFCDKILVISDGKVEAFDTHRELMKNPVGTYYRLFTSQAANYRHCV
jgi:ATP-binding cassette subfamily B protein